MGTIEFKEKFIAFVDILGFKDMIEAAEKGNGRSTTEIDEILREFEREKYKNFYREYGPQICPYSSYVQKDLDFEVTQISDCAIISSEISPAGAINIVNHCWAISIMLLTKGVMVRGYITRGKIHHKGNKLFGTGYQEAYKREAEVTAFKKEADEKGTPFIEIDNTVSRYILNETDECVREMFDRYSKFDGDLNAIFPFKSLSHSFLIGGFGLPPFNPENEKTENNKLRSNIVRLKDCIEKYSDKNNEKAQRKIRHYLASLDRQLEICDETDAAIDAITQPFPRLSY